MRMKRTLPMAVLAATVASAAIAEEKRETIYLTPFAAFQLFDDDRDLSETGTFGLGVEYRFLPRWAVEAVYSQASADRKYVAGESDFSEIRLDGTYYFANPEETWNPYVSIGAGHADFGDDQVGYETKGTDHDETRVNVGAGFRYNVSDDVSLRGDLREFHGVGEDTFDTQVALGFSLAFSRTLTQPAPAPKAPSDSDGDGVMDGSDQCPNSAPGVNVDSKGCELDSDNDGVANSKDQCPATAAGASVDSRGCELDSDNDGVVNSKDQCPGTQAGATVDAQGCEGVLEVVETVELNVNFPTNSSVIGSQYDSEIQRVADYLQRNPKMLVEIAGHTDDRGAANYNQFLSQRRADAVAQRLINVLGVSADRVTATGYGEAEPKASNDTAAGREANRRVEARFEIRR